MLIKEELRGIPLLPAPSVQTQTHRTDYLTAVDCVELKRTGEVLVADIYRAKDESLYARFFSDGKGYYTCNSWPDGAFGKSNPAHGWWGMVDSISYEEDTALAEIFLGKSRKDSWRSKGALAVIDAFISDCQQDKRYRAEERKEILRLQHFSMFPGLPENIEKYCDEQVFKHSYIFFDKLTKTGRRYARCGNCGKKYRVPKTVKRNQEKFPDDFCFQLSETEYQALRFQFGTSKEVREKKGGRRYLPYVYTEQGISMLSAVLRSEVAVNVSVKIMRTFVEMRRFFTNNSLLFEQMSEIRAKQLEYQKSTDEKFDEIFTYISEHEEVSQKIFFEGQIYDAFSLLTHLVSKAEKSIVLIDNYVDIGTLNILAKKNANVKVVIYTLKRTKLSQEDINNFNHQYKSLLVNYTNMFHDRFLIIDDSLAYHIGASLKDAGKKCFAINKIEDKIIVKDILHRLYPKKGGE